MSEENLTVETALEEAILDQIEALQGTKAGSEEQVKTARAVADLYKVRNEQQKIEADYAIATEAQAIDREKIDADKETKGKQAKVDTVGHIVKGAGTVLGIAANTAWILWTMASEKEGHIPGITAATKFLTKIKIL